MLKPPPGFLGNNFGEATNQTPIAIATKIVDVVCTIGLAVGCFFFFFPPAAGRGGPIRLGFISLMAEAPKIEVMPSNVHAYARARAQPLKAAR